jgi:uncharacterized protein (TIGR03435 family)
MKRQQAEATLDRFFEECGDAVPAQSEVDPVLGRVWERLEWKADEFVGARIPAAPARPFRFVWAVGIVLIAVLVNALIWRQGTPSSIAVKTANTDAKLSTAQAGDTLQLTATQDVFELASVKLLSPSSEAFKTASTLEAMQLAFTGCTGGYIGGARLDPGRLTIPGTTVLSLVITAYGQECTLVEGGPAWARSGEFYEIQGLLPADTPKYRLTDLGKGNAPRLQRMLQNLLADRFRLVLKREFREMPVYALTVARPGKMTLSPEETRLAPASFPLMPGMPRPQLARGQKIISISPSGDVQMSGHAISISDLAKDLRQHAGRIVVDKTGLKDLFDIDLKFSRDLAPSTAAIPPAQPQSIPPVPGTPPPVAPLPGPSLHTAIEEQLGLKLESARMPIEVLIIESVERPSEN